MAKDKYEGLKLENQICFPLYSAARKITGMYTPFLKPLGITYTQYIVFLVLWEEHHLTVGDLCEKLYLDSGTITPLLKKMEEREWVTRTRSKIDERVVLVDLTEEGKAMREKCLDIPKRISSCVSFSITEASDLYKLLHQILEEF
ncbi:MULTISPECIES: MarR family winged helix-turn-helix transcriptional regulator [Terrabacteria group]|uniref:MarR family winged helix-turn-helix transcriptional regulator n=1 Tax=Bacillati TaxID=1783272 RepID=UPI00193A3C14|nr:MULTISPECIES: MarR family transcriptional regulator [Terrabacteria group]MBW9212583.1 MarR family transcriptional regulator [Trueperella sp. zg.1013]QRG86666.1 MarR family transcriptional regulator [Bulleidia sp. zg-1006]